MSRKSLILKCQLPPGDAIMLTAAVRDLHRLYPDRYLTDVVTPHDDLWEGNPYVTVLDRNDRSIPHLECHYPLIQQSNQRPVHFLNGFHSYIGEHLQIDLYPSDFRGDIHLHPWECRVPSAVQKITQTNAPFWLIVSGGKYDCSTKWWPFKNYQRVVDHYRGRLLFVQVGKRTDYHPTLSGTLDMRGNTSLRELIRLVHHSQGIVCPITALMHLAAAVPRPEGKKCERPCVVVAGGREPAHWESYPGHQYLHTIGALDCCAQGGCWRSRIVPLGDGSPLDHPDQLCLKVVDGQPQCFRMIPPERVIAAIDLYLLGDHSDSLVTQNQWDAVEPFLSADPFH